jgi:hypothetical protein
MTYGRVEVRTVVPPLTMKQLARLPEHLQSAHFLWSESHPSESLEIAYSVTANSCPNRTGAEANPRIVDTAVIASAS